MCLFIIKSLTPYIGMQSPADLFVPVYINNFFNNHRTGDEDQVIQKKNFPLRTTKTLDKI